MVTNNAALEAGEEICRLMRGVEKSYGRCRLLISWLYLQHGRVKGTMGIIVFVL